MATLVWQQRFPGLYLWQSAVPEQMQTHASLQAGLHPLGQKVLRNSAEVVHNQLLCSILKSSISIGRGKEEISSQKGKEVNSQEGGNR